MTNQQKMALDNPTFLGVETAHPKFSLVLHGLCSIVLTINAGYE